MFHPTSLDPVEVIMTMIRAIKIDHDTNPECSLFGIHIRHMTNDNNLGVYIGILWFFIETYDNLLSSCCCYMAALYFETHFLEFKNVLDLWFELVHDVFVLIDVLACILTTF